MITDPSIINYDKLFYCPELIETMILKFIEYTSVVKKLYFQKVENCRRYVVRFT